MPHNVYGFITVPTSPVTRRVALQTTNVPFPIGDADGGWIGYIADAAVVRVVIIILGSIS